MKEKFYFGTYTKRKSEGIYSVILNRADEKLENLNLEKKVNSPTYITKYNSHLAAVSNINNLGGITLFLGNEQLANNSEQATPCYIANYMDYFLTANYHTSSVCLYKNIENNLILLDTVTHSGKGIKAEQEKSHIHFSDWTPDKKFVVVCDLGTDKLLTYKIIDEKLKLVATYSAQAGSGARHIVFHPKKDIAYLICELEATIEVLSYCSTTGEFNFIDKISLINNVDEKKWAAALKITSNGKFLYATNRGENTISAFKILEDGNLEKIASYSTFGNVPRDFNINSTEEFIIVAHQESDNLTLFKINSDGSLSLLEKDFYTPEAVCVIS